METENKGPEPADRLVWSNEHGRWWGPGRWGYTAVIGKAGRYTKSAADQICAGANFGDVINEVAVLAPEATPDG